MRLFAWRREVRDRWRMRDDRERAREREREKERESEGERAKERKRAILTSDCSGPVISGLNFLS